MKMIALVFSVMVAVMLLICSCKPTQPQETVLFLKGDQLDEQLLAERGQAGYTLKCPIHLAPGQTLHLNAISNRPVSSGYSLPDGKSLFDLQLGKYGYDEEISSSVIRIRDQSASSVTNFEIKIGGKPALPGDAQHLPNGVYPAGYYPIVFYYDAFYGIGIDTSPIYTAAEQEWKKTGHMVTIQDLTDLAQKLNTLTDEVTVRYWIEN